MFFSCVLSMTPPPTFAIQLKELLPHNAILKRNVAGQMITADRNMSAVETPEQQQNNSDKDQEEQG